MYKDSGKVYLVVHMIWTVKGGEPLLQKPVRHILYAHLKVLFGEKLCKLISINGTENHLHCLFQLHPIQALSPITKHLKATSAQWVNENKFLKTEFEWEEGYAALSVSPSGVKQVIDFIQRQEEYHKTKTLENELAIFEKVEMDSIL